ncbi:N-acetylneuraminate synthase family protein [Paracoccaceae bacterium]|nr:N-acetylneuraminate synthase family protein [Paracoccaceae bacterium]
MNNSDLFHQVLAKTTEKPFVIAEVGQAHDGSLGQALSFIDAASEAGANAVKFQTHFADEESSKYDDFRVRVFPQDSSRKDYWKRMEFSEQEWGLLAKRSQERGLVFLSSAFSNKAVEVLQNCEIEAWKIASGELFNYPMLDEILDTQAPLLISTGMSGWSEIDEIYHYTKGRERVIFQCTTEYPSKPQSIGINNIQLLCERYPDCVIGLSDHSGEIYPCLSAFVLGARVFEVHVTWSKKMFGPDTTSSLTIEDLSNLTRNLDLQSTMFSSELSKDKSQIEKKELSYLFGRGIYARHDISVGQVITADDLQYLKPAKGIHAKHYKRVIGSCSVSKIEQGEPIAIDQLDIKL